MRNKLHYYGFILPGRVLSNFIIHDISRIGRQIVSIHKVKTKIKIVINYRPCKALYNSIVELCNNNEFDSYTAITLLYKPYHL